MSQKSKFSTEDFIKKSKEIHGDKYGYSKVNYVNNSTKVIIICPTHGEFLQAPAHHWQGKGCPKCNGRFMDSEFFKEKAREIYGDKYDYSKAIYVNQQTKVIIGCPEHGFFEQNPNSHLRGHGCAACTYNKKLNINDFIEKARKIHGDKYDYSKVDYVNSNPNITIICPEHGEFLQKVSSHINGKNGCPKCGSIKNGNAKILKAKKKFIEKIKEIHGDKYDYSKTNYINSGLKVTITCKEHGDFTQLPYSHLNGNGCPKCHGFNRTTKEFIEEARKIHGDKYDYSLVKYVNAKTLIEIICPKHGVFKQQPTVHLTGCGCSDCGDERTSEKLKSNTEKFVQKAKLVHGDKFDYSKTVYTKNSNKVIIICKIHGEFEQNAASHLAGCECPKCHGFNKTAEDFINEARAIHGDRYDYSKTKYINSNTKVIITCREHGDFSQMPTSHLSGTGCRTCTHNRLVDTEEFIRKARLVHGDKYDYSKVKYVHNQKEVIIICPIHGEFKQRPAGHIQGAGCKKCGLNMLRNHFSHNTKIFIEKARKVHGDKYDYSKVEYVNSSTKVIIICPEHGEWTTKPSNHLNSKNCPKCQGRNKTTEEFIEEAKKVHGDKYDYSKTIYNGSDKFVTIICPIHGEFKQRANGHLRGGGCLKCIGRNKSTEEYIQQARKVHNDKYDYSKVNYVKGLRKITIICPEHGEFQQSAIAHLRGAGCKMCCGYSYNYISYEEAKKIVQPIMQELMKKLGRQVYGDDYSRWWDENRTWCLKIGLPRRPNVYYTRHK